MPEKSDLATKVCFQCCNEIPANAKICTACSSFQNWRRHLNFSSTVLALLVALVSVSTPLLGWIDEKANPPNSNIAITQVRFVGVPNAGKEEFLNSRLKFQGILTNLGHRPGLLGHLGAVGITRNFSISLYSRSNASYVQPGSQSIEIDASIIISSFSVKKSNLKSERKNVLNAIKSGGDFIFAAKVQNFDDSISNVNYKVSKNDVRLFLQLASYQCKHHLEKGLAPDKWPKFLYGYSCRELIAAIESEG